MENIGRTPVLVEFDNSTVEGTGVDIDDALRDALRRLSVQRGRGEWFVLSAKRRDNGEADHSIAMSYQTKISKAPTDFAALDLGRHYRGAIETVKVIANLQYGFAGRTRHAVEEVAIYAIGAARYLTQVSGESIDVRGDIGKVLTGTRWKKLVDVDSLILKRSG
jgi:hypothetical protein